MATRKPLVINAGKIQQLQSGDTLEDTIPAGGLIPGGRLTLSSGDPVPASDVTGVATVYYTPYLHSFIDLYDTGVGKWRRFNFTEKSFSIPTTGTALPIDIFGVITSNDLALAEAVWSSDTARATALVRQDGYWFLGSGSPPYNHLYLGTVRTVAASNVIEDSAAKRFCWNHFNRVERPIAKTITATGYTYNTAAMRSVNSDTTFRVQAVCGLAGVAWMNLDMLIFATSAPATFVAGCGIGVGSTTVNSARTPSFEVGIAGAGMMMQARLQQHLPLGFQFYQALERGGGGAGNYTWFNGTDRGLFGWIMA